MKGVAALGLALLVALAEVLAAQEGEEVLTNADIVALTEAGLPASVIVAKMSATDSDFDTTVEQLVVLAGAGVDAAVIEAMTKAAAVGREPLGVTSQPALGGVPTAQVAPTATAWVPRTVFRDTLRSGGEGPEMVVIPAGRFRMGCLSSDGDCEDTEKPVREVTIPQAFALSVYEVTFEDYDQFMYPSKVGDCGYGRGRRPAISIAWVMAKEYVAWLSGETGKEYRLPSESEWEYAARSGTSTKYSWGNDIGLNRANCSDYGDGGCGDRWEETSPVGSFAPNGFGLYDMHGNADEWVEDCWNGSYAGAPSDGSAWRDGNCARRVVRGGNKTGGPEELRVSGRKSTSVDSGYGCLGFGFRLARTLGSE